MNEHPSDPTIESTTLVDLLRWRALRQPDQRAYTFLVDGETEEVHLTYQELDRQARAIGAQLQDLGAVGERALLLYPPGLEYIAGFFGCLYTGAIAVPAYPPDPTRLNRTLPRLRAIVNDAQPLVVLTTSPILAMAEALLAQDSDFQSMHWVATDSVVSDPSTGGSTGSPHRSGQALAEEWEDSGVSGDTLAFLQYTSGSTAAPRGVMLTHNNLLHNSALIHGCFGLTPDSRGVIWLPPYHDMGLIGGILQPLYGGFPVTLMSPIDFLKRPFRWLQAISCYKGTTSGGPNFAYDLCVRKITPEQRATLNLSSWDLAFNGAEPVRHDTMERFAAAFESCGFRKEAFYPCYGLAEATLIVSGGLKAAPPVVQTVNDTALGQNRVETVASTHADARTLVGCGHTLTDQEIAIANPDTLHQCPPGQVGEIWVSGPSVAQGYWNRPEATAEAFQAYLADTGEGPFLCTGDLGFLQNGELFIAGRRKDLIIIRGRNHYPQDIERTVEQSHPALRPGCGAAFSVEVAGEERLVVAQEIRHQTTDLDLNEVVQIIRQAVAEEHELQVYGVLLLQARSIPKTSSGKIQRHACRAGFLSDSLDVVAKSTLDVDVPPAEAPPTQPEESFIRKALTVVDEPAMRHSLLTLYLQEQAARALRLAPSQVDTEQPLSTLGLDSLMAIEIAHKVEASLGVPLPMADLLQGPSISELASQILPRFEESPATPPARIVPLQEPTAEHPLSRGQRAMWFLHRLAPESAAYNIASAVQIGGELDIPALQRAFQKLVDRHPSLRTTFPVPHGEPIQHIHDQVEVCFQLEDASTCSEASLSERLVEEAHRPFDLEQGPLLRVHLFSRSAQEHIFLLVVHHIVADFWSLAVLVRELGTLYQAEQVGAPTSLPPLTLQYFDYTRWQADMLTGPEGERLWAYWQQQLSGELPVLDLPTDRPRPAVQTYRGASQALRLSAELTEGLKALSRTHGATLYMTLLAVFQALLHRYTGQEDILIGSPTAGRNGAELAGLVGYFINPVVLRADSSGNPPFAEFLDRIRQTVLDAFAHQDYPFDLLVERLQPKRDPGRSPVFQVWFVLQQSPISEMAGLAPFALGEAGARMDVGGLSLESVALEQRTAQFDLALAAAETADGLGVSLQYNSDLFEAATIRRMLGHFQSLLEGIVAQAEQRLSDLPLLTEAERQQLLEAWNDTQADYPREICLHQLFENQAERTPDGVAAVFEDQQPTYRELNRRANQLAHYLRKLGVGPETLVGIYMERSLEMIVGLLGTLKCGGTYVPLDPDHPQERIALLLKDAQTPVLLTQERLLEGLTGHGAQTVCVDTDWGAITRQSEANPASLVSSESLAYVIYTSGSTGKPKGVQISHRAVVNFLNSMRHQPGLTDRDVLLSVTTLSFDIAGLELFLPLSVGASVVLVNHEVATDGVQLAARLTNSGATVMQATPATWRLLLESGWPGSRRLKILCGGEAFPRELANQLVEKGAALWNMYGPTESTIWSAIHPLEAGDGPVSIGRPIANTQIYLLDACLQPVPVGVPGELYIGGDGLARGYFNRPSLTAEKFIPNPFSDEPGSRLYRTGDLARYRPDGHIEFLGRIDHQMKIRGFRIELGEIEAALSQHPTVRETVVVAREDAPGDKRLVAYVVPKQEPAPTVSELRRFLKGKLPDYMVPSNFVMLDVLPLTPNGKVDRRALPSPQGLRPELEVVYATPKTELERHIAAVWQEVLKVEKVGAHDNFFELGGHSLLMARIHGQLQGESFGKELSMVELFQYPTVHSLAKHLSQAQIEQLSLQSSRERVEIRSARRASMSQQRQRRRKSRSTK